MMNTSRISTYRKKVPIKADRLIDNAKATEEAFDKAGFSREFPIQGKKKRLLFDLFHAFVKTTNLPVQFPPKHLTGAFDWLLKISGGNPNIPSFFKGLKYPTNKISKMPKVLYQVDSIPKKARAYGPVFLRPVIFWVYSDQKNRPLVDYFCCISNYPLLNHWGVLNSVQALDELFSESEADLLRKYLEKDNRLMEIKINPVKLPMLGDFSMSLEHEGRFHLYEEGGYKLPFKVTGVLKPGVWEIPHKISNKENTQNQ
jgi:hypothetical protein